MSAEAPQHPELRSRLLLAIRITLICLRSAPTKAFTASGGTRLRVGPQVGSESPEAPQHPELRSRLLPAIRITLICLRSAPTKAFTASGGTPLRAGPQLGSLSAAAA